MTPSYVKIIEAGPAYEYGHIEQHPANRRKDRQVRDGVADTYEAACEAAGIKPVYRTAPPAP